jgi:hypothetical protein
LNSHDVQKFNELMDLTAEIYDKKLSSGLAKLYWDDLHRYGLEAIEQAFRLYRQDEKNKKFPTVAHILQKLRPDNRDKRTISKCFDFDCTEPVTHYVNDLTNIKRGLCSKHYVKYAPKSEIDKRIDDGAKQFEKEAKELGLTNQQYFRKKFNITDDKNNVEAIQQAITDGRNKS